MGFEVGEEGRKGGGVGLGGVDGKTGLGEAGRGEPDALGVCTGRVEVNFGGEVLMGDVAGLDGLKFDEREVGFAVNHEHEVDCAAEVGGTAVDAGFVGVVDEDDGKVHAVGECPELLEDGDEGEDGVFVCAREDACERVNDDEFGVVDAGVDGEGMDIFGVAEVYPGEGGDVEAEVFGGIVGAHGLGKTDEEAVESGFFVDPEDITPLGLSIKPGFAEGEGYGEVEDGVGLFGPRCADNKIETGLDDEVLDEPVGFVGVVEGLVGWVGCEGFVTVRYRGGLVFSHEGIIARLF